MKPSALSQWLSEVLSRRLRKGRGVERCCGVKLVLNGLQNLFSKSAWLNFGNVWKPMVIYLFMC